MGGYLGNGSESSSMHDGPRRLITVLLWGILGIGGVLGLRGAGIAPAGAAPLAAPRQREYPVNAESPGEDLTLQGSAIKRALNFPVYPHWRIEATSTLRLELRW